MAKIRFLQAVEDSTNAIVTDDDGSPEVAALVDKFAAGQEVEIGSERMPQNRADKLVRLGVAEVVE